MLYVEPDEQDPHFYKNGQADEMVYVSKGSGVLESVFGDLPVPRRRLSRHSPRDHAPLPARHGRGTDQAADHREPRPRAVAEALSQRVRPAARRARRTRSGTFDARRELRTVDQMGDFRILVKQYNGLNEIILDHHPFDVVGWDGYFYPWAFNINDFEPIVGRVHQPPPVHQTFQGDGFVVCSFCPRPFDFDPNALPGAVQPQQRRLRRGAVLRVERVHEPQGHRVREHHAPSRRHPARPASRAGGSEHRGQVHERAGGDDGFVPAAQSRQGRAPPSKIPRTTGRGSTRSTCSSIRRRPDGRVAP